MTGMVAMMMDPGVVLAASASPAAVSASSATAGTLTTGNTTATGTGGTVTGYAWELVSGGSGITINNAAGATTSFSGSVGAVTPSRSGTYRCKVTFSGGGFAYTNNVSVTLTYTG